MRRLPLALYLLTSLITLFASWALFAHLYDTPAKSYIRALVSLATLYFAAPTLFLLASALSFWTKEESNWARWIAGASVLIILAPLIHREHGWKLFIETVGPLISIVFVLDSLVRRPSTIAVIAAVTYGIFQGDDLYFRLWFYWRFGGTVPYFLTEITTPLLVTASLVAAIASSLAMRKRSLGQVAKPR